MKQFEHNTQEMCRTGNASQSRADYVISKLNI